MKKRLFASAIVLCFLFGCLSTVTSAALFEKTRVYTSSVFGDIAEKDWFYKEIANCYEMGIVGGDGSGNFYPYDLISRAEVISIAARVHSAYEKDGHSFVATEGEKWYAPYVKYSIESKIIKLSDFDEEYTLPASRREVAYIYANALPYTEFRNINTGINSLPDVADSDEYYNQIIMLYRAGVIAGKDASGKFSPREHINRAEATAIVNRVVDASQRIQVTFQGAEQPGTGKHSAVEISEKCSPAIFYIEVFDRYGSLYGSGSGFFISEDGVAVTNHHVIENAYSAKIRLPDGTEYGVSGIRNSDPEKDLAIIQVDGRGFPYLTIGDSNGIKNGQPIFCVGSPLGFENTISEGIISNVKRNYGGKAYFQITAPISNGSSGGAVLDESGKVIGVSTAGFDGGQNLNLAVPINYVKDMNMDMHITFEQFQSGNTGLPGVNQTPGSVGFYLDTNVPDYSTITGRKAFNTGMLQDETAYCYEYVQAEVQTYLAALVQNGFHYYRTMPLEDGVSVEYYKKGEDRVGICVIRSEKAVFILVK